MPDNTGEKEQPSPEHGQCSDESKAENDVEKPKSPPMGRRPQHYQKEGTVQPTVGDPIASRPATPRKSDSPIGGVPSSPTVPRPQNCGDRTIISTPTGYPHPNMQVAVGNLNPETTGACAASMNGNVQEPVGQRVPLAPLAPQSQHIDDANNGEIKRDIIGYCVMCEIFSDAILEHYTSNLHSYKVDINLASDKKNVIVALKGTNLDSELYNCGVCEKFVYKGRKESHECLQHPSFNKGTGNFYCLMCQMYFTSFESEDGIFNHYEQFHLRCSYMTFLRLKGVFTLCPINIAKTDLQECCNNCDLFTFKMRPKISCRGQVN